MSRYTVAPRRLFDSSAAGSVTERPSALRGEEARSLTARGRSGVPDTATLLFRLTSSRVFVRHDEVPEEPVRMGSRMSVRLEECLR
jgi:hypothetical protein